MAVDVLLGLQWGDEGKGKVVDVFTPKYDIVARFQGGPNAGHTIEFKGQKHVLHLIPSGIFHPGTLCLIGSGVVIDPVTLKIEIEKLLAAGVKATDSLLVANRAHLILPSHRAVDAATETSVGDKKIGSTLRGIGPTYRDKVGRDGLRVGDIDLPDFKKKYETLKEKHRMMVEFLGMEFNVTAQEDAFFDGIEYLRGLNRVNSEQFLYYSMAEGKSILAEGAQGTLLDIDFGSYPYVTSSNTITAGACTGLGIPPTSIGRVFGIFKAYCTRVGSGPFPTELINEQGEKLRKAGSEFGATTGRPRRCGWLDLPALKYAIRLNGVTDLIMTKADVLSTFDEVKVCEAYRINGSEHVDLPYSLEQNIEPILRSFPSWGKTDHVREKADLPPTLVEYIQYLEKELEVPITILSVGPDRDQTLVMETHRAKNLM
jgi:adenylosuccinate synthase